MNNAFRLVLSAILGFGWLLGGISQASSDPLTIAAQDIQQLEIDIDNLIDKSATQGLIDTAKYKYNLAVQAEEDLENAQEDYNSAVELESNTLAEKQSAQLAVDTQLPIRNAANTNKNNKYDTYYAAQIALNAHISLYGTGGAQGVSFQIFPLSRMGNYAYIAEGSGLMCQGSIPTFDVYDGWGGICGLSQNIIGIFNATVTIPSNINTIKFAGITDDGFRLYVNGVLATELWQEQGPTWSDYTPWYDVSVNKTLQLQAWWYNGGGPGSMHVAYMTPEYLTGIPSEWLTWGTPLSQQRIDERQVLQADRDAKYAEYQTALSTYNTENNKLIQYQNTLVTKTTAYNNAVTNADNAESYLDTATNNYNEAILEMQESIVDAEEEYAKQWDIEEKRRIAAAIMQALANQPKPEPTPELSPTPQETIEPEPTPEPEASSSYGPTPQPSPEQTKPVDPNPEPSPDTTNEPKPEPTAGPEPTPEPSPKPSPQPSDINPKPTVEPKPIPDEPSKESSDNNITNNLGAIANLTSKDNIVVKLTPEQAAAVANVLVSLSSEARSEVAKDFGIKSEEVITVASLAKDNPAIASAIITFAEKAKENIDAPMPYTLADAIAEAAAEQFLDDPLAVFKTVDLEKVLDPSQWGKDMTDDQREKAQEVVIPVVLVSNIVASVASAMSIRRI